MNIVIYAKNALHDIKAHLSRSFLTILGVLIGTAAIVGLLTGSQLATQTALKEVKKLGSDLLALRLNIAVPYLNQWQNNYQNYFQQFAVFINSSTAYTLNYDSVFINNEKLDINVLGVAENLANLLKPKLLLGRFISDLDNNSLYCVVGNNIARSFHHDFSDLIGTQIGIGHNFFTIIGVLDKTEQSSFLPTDTNNAVLIPINTSLTLYQNARVNNIIFKLKSEKQLSAAELAISQKLKSDFPDSHLDFTSPESIIKQVENQNHTFNLLLIFIGSIALLVSGIGIMNIMLVSVSERRTEIGIRIAVGARHRDILYLFLLQSIILSVIGGLIGVLVGEIATLIMAKFSHWDIQFLLTPISLALLVSLTVGLLFGYYPAYKASQFNTIEILRAN